MKAKDSHTPVDLLVIITRLHAARNANNDEFKSEWSPPKTTAGLSGIIDDKQNLAGFWSLSDDGKAGLVVIHGHQDLLAKKKGAFQIAVLKSIGSTDPTSKRFSSLAVIAHGKIPETNCDLSADKAPPHDQLRARFHDNILFASYSLSKDSAAHRVPEVLQTCRFPEPLIALVRERLKLTPTVDRIVRSMQYILFEMRLCSDRYFQKQAEIKAKQKSPSAVLRLTDDQEAITAEIKDCLNRLNSDEHWNNRAVKQARGGFNQLVDLLAAPVRDLIDTSADTESLKTVEGLTYPSLITRSDLDAFLRYGSPSYVKSSANMNACLRAFAARLENLIALAARIDMEEGGRMNGRE